MKIDAVVNLGSRKQKKKNEEQKKIKENLKSFIEKNTKIQLIINTTHSSEGVVFLWRKSQGKSFISLNFLLQARKTDKSLYNVVPVRYWNKCWNIWISYVRNILKKGMKWLD